MQASDAFETKTHSVERLKRVNKYIQIQKKIFRNSKNNAEIETEEIQIQKPILTV
jgi:hypothetical protein